MFVDTTWVKIDDLNDFLREREVSVHGMNYLIFFSELMKHLQENARDKHVTDASKAIKKERADSPNLVIKQEP
jgi:CRISPR/Cas system CMR-associated protein Cmr3 (group 5 of RAMP superfamily)